MPFTVVHGDFTEKNIRVRTTGTGIAILPFDWGNAGWGFQLLTWLNPGCPPLALLEIQT